MLQSPPQKQKSNSDHKRSIMLRRFLLRSFGWDRAEGGGCTLSKYHSLLFIYLHSYSAQGTQCAFETQLFIYIKLRLPPCQINLMFRGEAPEAPPPDGAAASCGVHVDWANHGVRHSLLLLLLFFLFYRTSIALSQRTPTPSRPPAAAIYWSSAPITSVEHEGAEPSGRFIWTTAYFVFLLLLDDSLFCCSVLLIFYPPPPP